MTREVRVIGHAGHTWKLALDHIATHTTITAPHHRPDAHDGWGPRTTLHLLAEVKP